MTFTSHNHILYPRMYVMMHYRYFTLRVHAFSSRAFASSILTLTYIHFQISPNRSVIQTQNKMALTYNVSNLSDLICFEDSCVQFNEMRRIINFERIVRVVVPCIFSLFIAVGFIGNLLVITVVITNKQMRNTTNILILSLAIADLMFIVFCVPFTATGYVVPKWPFGDVWCKLTNYMTYVCAYASVYTLVLMSLDRYLAVVHPIRSMSIRTVLYATLMVSFTWGAILVANIPIVFQFGIFNYTYYGEDRRKCLNIAARSQPSVEKYFFGFFFGFGYAIPLILVCILYGLLLKRLLYNVAPRRGQSSDSGSRVKRRVTRMAIIVVAIFAVCWLPIQVALLVQHFSEPTFNIFFIGFQMAGNCLAYMNSCVNPILYAFLSENFRKGFRKLLFCPSSYRPGMDCERTNFRGTTDRCSVSRATTINTLNTL